MCSYSQQCVEENTVLTQGRIILWARGSLANDGSTVKTSVPIFNSAWMKKDIRILNCAWMKICVHILKCVEESTVLTQGRIILWAGGSLADDGSTVKTSVPIFNSAWMKKDIRILNCAWMKICVHILKCVEESTVLTQGRIILWAGGSLDDDGSTVKTSVPIFNTAWMKICVRILKIVWIKICVCILNSVLRKT